MRVLFVSPAVLAGRFDALADQTIFLARSASKLGHDVTIFTDGQTGQIDSDQPIRIVVTGKTWGFESVMPFLRTLKMFGRNDVVVLQYTSFNYGPQTISPLVFVALCKFLRIPIRVFAHEFFYRRPHAAIKSALREYWFSFRDRVVLRLADIIIVSGVEAQHRLEQELPKSSAKTLPVGIFSNVERPDVLWSPHTRQRKVWLSFGAVTARRRLELLVDGLVDALRAGTDAELRIIGRINDATYAEQIRQYSQERGVADRVELTGMVSRERVADELLSADLVLHAAAEGLTANSSTLSAAFVYGIPVVAIATDHDEPALTDCAITVAADELGSTLSAISLNGIDVRHVVVAGKKRADDVLDLGKITQAVLAGIPA